MWYTITVFEPWINKTSVHVDDMDVSTTEKNTHNTLGNKYSTGKVQK